MYILFTGKPIVNGNNPKQILKKIKELKEVDFSEVNMQISELGCHCLKKMLCIDPSKRYSASLLL